MSANSLNLAVVGTGAMGQNHARVIDAHPDTNLFAVVDSDAARADAVSQRFGSKAFTDINDVLGESLDGIIIATPSRLHTELGVRALSAGIPALIEKPLALTLEDAEETARVAQENDVPLMVGHIELFNPVVQELRHAIGNLTVRRIVCQRLGYVDDRSRLYHNVVDDLMVHDIAIVLELLEGRSPTVAYAYGRADTPADPDPADAHLLFPGAVDVRLSAARSYAGGKKRTIAVEAEECVVRADLIEGKIENITAGEGNFEVGGHSYMQNTRVGVRVPKAAEPLVSELQHFIDCIRGEKAPEDAAVSAQHAIRVLKVTESILSFIRNSTT